MHTIERFVILYDRTSKCTDVNKALKNSLQRRQR